MIQYLLMFDAAAGKISFVNHCTICHIMRKFKQNLRINIAFLCKLLLCMQFAVITNLLSIFVSAYYLHKFHILFSSQTTVSLAHIRQSERPNELVKFWQNGKTYVSTLGLTSAWHIIDMSMRKMIEFIVKERTYSKRTIMPFWGRCFKITVVQHYHSNGVLILLKGLLDKLRSSHHYIKSCSGNILIRNYPNTWFSAVYF